MSKTWRVSLTEKRYIDWVVEVEADTQEQAEEIALATFHRNGTSAEHEETVDIDWSEEIA